MAQPEGCPAAVATAKPGREGWALEEAWDIAVEADPGGRVAETRFRGVYLIYADPLRLARTLLRSTPAFLRSVTVSSKCVILGNDEPGYSLGAILGYVGSCTVKARLRGESKILEEGLKRISAGRVTGGYNCMVHIEGVGRLLLLAKGPARDCGFGCTLIIDDALERAIRSL